MFANLFKSFKTQKNAQAPKQEQKRHNDAIFVIRQDNKNKTFPIEATNKLALSLLGYNDNELLNKDLRDFVGDEVVEALDENVEFTNDGVAINEVLKKMSNFKIRTKSGSSIPLKIRIISGLSSAEAPRFQLVMNDRTLFESLTAHRMDSWFDLSKDKIYDTETGILKREWIEEDIKFIQSHGKRNQAVGSCLAIFKFGNIDSDVFSMCSEKVHKSKREEDIVGLIDKNTMVLIFTETPYKNIVIPVDRMLSRFPDHIAKKVIVRTGMIDNKHSPKELLDNLLNK